MNLVHVPHPLAGSSPAYRLRLSPKTKRCGRCKARLRQTEYGQSFCRQLYPSPLPRHSCGEVITTEADGMQAVVPLPISGGDVNEEPCLE